tara:strand:+ start:340 stop:1173 length:834 start_codon:yes stop_codon:yes gene_type:complete
MANEEHMQRVEAHYRALGMKNPHAAHFASMRSRSGGKTGGPLGSGARARTGGLGSGKGASRYENTSASDRRAANRDDSFGYFDEVNKRFVPAIIDMIDGGGRNTRGDDFVGGPLSGVLNQVGVEPYGSQRERMFVSPNTSPFVPQQRPRVRPDSVENEAAMQAQEASFNQPNPTPMTAQEMSFTQPRSTPRNLQEISFTQPVSNPFMGPTYDMPVDPRTQFNSLSEMGGPISRIENFKGFSKFLETVKNDPNMSFLMNDLPMAKSVYDRMVASGTRF